jgi:hypothetical protein
MSELKLRPSKEKRNPSPTLRERRSECGTQETQRKREPEKKRIPHCVRDDSFFLRVCLGGVTRENPKNTGRVPEPRGMGKFCRGMADVELRGRG